jgi:signal transduction histidine kinase
LQTLAERNAELDRFAYTVSHDLKSPLVTIKGFLGAIERSALDGKSDRLHADIARIDAAADRMRQLLDELLELSRVGRIAGPSVAIELNELIAETIEALTGVIQSHRVVLDIESELPQVRGDRVRLRQVLQNLIENALKFMGDQPTPRIEVGARRKADRILCWVRDNGIGIEAPYVEKVFELFEQLDRTSPGTGIGLALVRRILEVHGGQIWAESKGKGAGTCFYFTLVDTASVEET